MFQTVLTLANISKGMFLKASSRPATFDPFTALGLEPRALFRGEEADDVVLSRRSDTVSCRFAVLEEYVGPREGQNAVLNELNKQYTLSWQATMDLGFVVVRNTAHWVFDIGVIFSICFHGGLCSALRTRSTHGVEQER